MNTTCETIQTPFNLLGLRWRQCHMGQSRKIPVRWTPPKEFIVRVRGCADLDRKCNLVRAASEVEAPQMGEQLLPAR